MAANGGSSQSGVGWGVFAEGAAPGRGGRPVLWSEVSIEDVGLAPTLEREHVPVQVHAPGNAFVVMGTRRAGHEPVRSAPE